MCRECLKTNMRKLLCNKEKLNVVTKINRFDERANGVICGMRD